ncbi:MAG TPA: 3-oxoacyl-ACP reductase FabG [Candidatus Baltobacteraceae bacterium]|jgi:NAD(P)-dependent dehydrogenase (short-subunit alcohol dehydrogenase family)|nr:3-oxoacyl-ACP reductase FabG [Candidatus Baltobacteraceae bacterium]
MTTPGTLTPLAGRVGIVTGGSRGIGGAITKILANDGAKVAVIGLPADRERTEHLRSSLNGTAQNVLFYEGNVGEYERCAKAVESILAEHGRIDFLVNNAGITADHTIRNMTIDEWNTVLQIDLSGPFFMIKAAIDHMVERGYGRIVNISSVVGLSGNVGQANYSAAKAGLIGLTKTVALEVAKKGITVNAVAPGFINTEMVAAMPESAIAGAMERTAVKRLGQPDEVARMVRFLVDENSGFITGSVFSVNGGMYM